ncbi:hypothetical protein J6590_021619 [Homalodisca vitripennis]|nr:hypothetical protein J6590_021619 [Homalodisca vitripennis]
MGLRVRWREGNGVAAVRWLPGRHATAAGSRYAAITHGPLDRVNYTAAVVLAPPATVCVTQFLELNRLWEWDKNVSLTSRVSVNSQEKLEVGDEVSASDKRCRAAGTAGAARCERIN